MSTEQKTARLAELTEELDALDAPVPAGVARLRAAREAAAAASEASSSYDSGRRIAQPGEWMYSVDEGGVKVMRSTSIFGSPSVNLFRGHEIEIDQAMLDADLDRHGRPGWSGLLYDEDAQIQKWGAVRLRPGRAPRDLESWTHGSALWAEAREHARREAHQLPTEEQRAAALLELHRRFGPPPVTSTTLNTAKSPSERAHAEQEARIRAAAAKGLPNIGSSRAGA